VPGHVGDPDQDSSISQHFPAEQVAAEMAEGLEHRGDRHGGSRRQLPGRELVLQLVRKSQLQLHPGEQVRTVVETDDAPRFREDLLALAFGAPVLARLLESGDGPLQQLTQRGVADPVGQIEEILEFLE
jgi:hypothetical protein